MSLINLIRLRLARQQSRQPVHLIPLLRPVRTLCGQRLVYGKVRTTSSLKQVTCELCKLVEPDLFKPLPFPLTVDPFQLITLPRRKKDMT